MKILFLLIFLSLFCPETVVASVPDDRRKEKIAAEEAQTARIIEARNYTFQLQTLNVMVPSLGVMRGIQAGYYITVTPDSLEVNLPFFGTFTDNYFDTDKSIRFRCSKYGYFQSKKPRGGWEIIIGATGKSGEQYTFYLTVSPRGGAFLKAVNQQRISISFDGVVVPAEPFEK